MNVLMQRVREWLGLKLFAAGLRLLGVNPSLADAEDDDEEAEECVYMRSTVALPADGEQVRLSPRAREMVELGKRRELVAPIVPPSPHLSGSLRERYFEARKQAR